MKDSPQNLLINALGPLMRIFDATSELRGRTFMATLKILKAVGFPKELLSGKLDLHGQEIQLAFQAPDKLQLAFKWHNLELVLGRDQQEIWLIAPANKFGLLGSAEAPRFCHTPNVKDSTFLGPIDLALIRSTLANWETAYPTEEELDGHACRRWELRLSPNSETDGNVSRGTLQLWIRNADALPWRLAYRGADDCELVVEMSNPEFHEPWPDSKWKIRQGETANIVTIARSHLTDLCSTAFRSFVTRLPPLGPITGERRLVAREGKGRLEMWDGTRVLFLKGTPEEMGRQHGMLLKKEVNETASSVCGLLVAGSFRVKSWVLGWLHSAREETGPFWGDRYVRELNALVDASGIGRDEVYLCNLFSELCHCSTFSLFGRATREGRLYHGRTLSLLLEAGFEQNSVVMVVQPDSGNAWVNIGFAGLAGSLTAMNDKQLTIGTVARAGRVIKPGKPVAQLIREVMENADTLDDAVELLRRAPRTGTFFYMISDAKSKRAVCIFSAHNKFETIGSGEAHPGVPHGKGPR